MFFDETSGRFLIAHSPGAGDEIERLADEFGVSISIPGVGGFVDDEDKSLWVFDDCSGENIGIVGLEIQRIREAHEGWLPNYMDSVG